MYGRAWVLYAFNNSSCRINEQRAAYEQLLRISSAEMGKKVLQLLGQRYNPVVASAVSKDIILVVSNLLSLFRSVTIFRFKFTIFTIFRLGLGLQLGLG